MAKRPVDVLFLHAGKRYGFPPISVPPMGTVALANYLHSAGMGVLACNVAVETALDPKFDAAALAAKCGAKLVCLDLHWHHQTGSVMDLALRLKRKRLSILLGGFTASYFHEEILRDHPEIDFVIRGDAEKPLLELVRCRLAGENRLGGIPNLCWRDGSKIVLNPQSYSTDSATFNALDFSDFGLWFNWRRASPDLETFELLRNGDLTPAKAARALADSRVFYYNCGRGCTYNCVFCGGGSKAHQLLCGRGAVLVGSPSAAMGQLRAAAANGFTRWHTDFFPEGLAPYYKKLFAAIRSEGLKFDITFGCWHMPDETLLHLAGSTFGSGSKIEISPDTGSELLRRRIGKARYTNKQLLALLKTASQLKIKCTVYFSAGLPYEGKKELLETFKLVSAIRAAHPDHDILVDSMEVSPAAPLFKDHDQLGCSLTRRTFADFHKASCDAEKHLGYTTRQLGDPAIRKLVGLIQSRADAKRP